jgi:hypothetical protein
MANDPFRRFIAGRNSMGTIIKIAVASIVVGAFLAFWGVSPGEFWRWIFDLVKGVVGWLGDSLGEIVLNLVTYFLFGAAIVVPIWLLARLFGGGRR